jgi:hypothetical protein
MCPGDLRGNHGQRAIALALVFEPILAHKDGMGVPAPLPHQARTGLQYDTGIERTSAFPELSREGLQAALQRAAWAAMGALLQLIGEPPDHQITTETHRRSGVMQCPPDMPQLLCRPIDQSGNLVIKLGQVQFSQSVLPAADWTEDGRRLTRVLASRSIVELGFHRLAGSAIR